MATPKQYLRQCEQQLYHKLLTGSVLGLTQNEYEQAKEWLARNGLVITNYKEFMDGVANWLSHNLIRCQNKLYEEQQRLLPTVKQALLLQLTHQFDGLDTDNSLKPAQELAVALQDVLKNDQSGLDDLQYCIQDYEQQPNFGLSPQQATNNQTVLSDMLAAVRHQIELYNQQRQHLNDIDVKLQSVTDRLRTLLNGSQLAARIRQPGGRQQGGFCNEFKDLKDTVDYVEYELSTSVQQAQNQHLIRVYSDERSNYQYLRSVMLPDLRSRLLQTSSTIINSVSQLYQKQEAIVEVIEAFYEHDEQGINASLDYNQLASFKSKLLDLQNKLGRLSESAKLSTEQAKWFQEQLLDNETRLRGLLLDYSRDKSEYNSSHFVQFEDYFSQLILAYTTHDMEEPDPPEALKNDPDLLHQAPEADQADARNARDDLYKLNYDAEGFITSNKAIKDTIIFFSSVAASKKSKDTIKSILESKVFKYVEGVNDCQALTELQGYLSDAEGSEAKQHLQTIQNGLAKYYDDVLPENVAREEHDIQQFADERTLINDYHQFKDSSQYSQVTKQARQLLNDLDEFGHCSAQQLKAKSCEFDLNEAPLGSDDDSFVNALLTRVLEDSQSDFASNVQSKLPEQDLEDLKQFEQVSWSFDNIVSWQKAMVQVTGLNYIGFCQKHIAQLLFVTDVKYLKYKLAKDHGQLTQLHGYCHDFLDQLSRYSEFDSNMAMYILECAQSNCARLSQQLGALVCSMAYLLPNACQLDASQLQLANSLFKKLEEPQYQHQNRPVNHTSVSDNEVHKLKILFDVSWEEDDLKPVSQCAWRQLQQAYFKQVYNCFTRVAGHFANNNTQDQNICHKRFPNLLEASQRRGNPLQVKDFDTWRQQFADTDQLNEHINTVVTNNYQASNSFFGLKKKGCYEQIKSHLQSIGLTLHKDAQDAVYVSAHLRPINAKFLVPIADVFNNTVIKTAQSFKCLGQMLLLCDALPVDNASHSDDLSLDLRFKLTAYYAKQLTVSGLLEYDFATLKQSLRDIFTSEYQSTSPGDILYQMLENKEAIEDNVTAIEGRQSPAPEGNNQPMHDDVNDRYERADGKGVRQLLAETFSNLRDNDLAILERRFIESQEKAKKHMHQAVLQSVQYFMRQKNITCRQFILSDKGEAVLSRFKPIELILKAQKHLWLSADDVSVSGQETLFSTFDNIKTYMDLCKRDPLGKRINQFLTDELSDYVRFNTDRMVGLAPSLIDCRELKVALDSVFTQHSEATSVQVSLPALNCARGLQFDRQLIEQGFKEGFSSYNSITRAKINRIIDKMASLLNRNRQYHQLAFLKQYANDPKVNDADYLESERSKFVWHQIVRLIDVARTQVDEEDDYQQKKQAYRLREPGYPDIDYAICRGPTPEQDEDPHCHQVADVRQINTLRYSEQPNMLFDSLQDAKAYYHKNVYKRSCCKRRSYDNVEKITHVSDLGEFAMIIFGQLGSKWRPDSLRSLAITSLTRQLGDLKPNDEKANNRRHSAISLESESCMSLNTSSGLNEGSPSPKEDAQSSSQASLAKKVDTHRLPRLFADYLKYMRDEYGAHSPYNRPVLLDAAPESPCEPSQLVLQQNALIDKVVDVVFNRLLSKGWRGWRGALNKHSSKVNAKVAKAGKILGALEQMIQNHSLTQCNMELMLLQLQRLTQQGRKAYLSNQADLDRSDANGKPWLKTMMNELSTSSSMFAIKTRVQKNRVANELFDSCQQDTCLSQLVQ